jgi:arylsulfatase A-like enzyme
MAVFFLDTAQSRGVPASLMLVRVFAGLVALATLVLGGLAPQTASAALNYRRNLGLCEPPSVFYSSRHQPGAVPCCASQPTMCPGGTTCPASGMCLDGSVCMPVRTKTRPNIILFISDDQGECHYGSAGECRSTQSGTPIPAPVTPNLDVLAGYGTTFPIAHNTAAWCYPSLMTMLTGRFQKSFGGRNSRLSSYFATIPNVLKTLPGDDAPVDPWSATPGQRIGSYCSYLGGKFTASSGNPGFDAGERGSGHRLGRLACEPGENGEEEPECGTDQDDTYDPLRERGIDQVFQFVDDMLYKEPGTQATFTAQPFFIWYAPRIPHQPLRAPATVETYLFGSRFDGLAGMFDLGRFCSGSSCPPVVRAFDESNFGTVREYFANVWWVDDNLRELRKFLQRASEPHCVGRNGEGRYEVTSPESCNGTWIDGVTPSLSRNTVIMYLSDNGWHLPNSKHRFAENGYRTRLVVFDPRTLPDLPSEARKVPPSGELYESPAVVHTSDLLPTALGFAVDSPTPVSCPPGAEGSNCDGRDLRMHLRTAPNGPAPSRELRGALCGHQTQRGTKATKFRYFLSRPDSVGRCVNTAQPSCQTASDCVAGNACVGGFCVREDERACSSTSQCAPGAACLGGRCRVAPPCMDDATCTALLPGQPTTCAAQGQKYCGNAPNQGCETAADCPACPTVNGIELPACGRVCKPRLLKSYFFGNRLEMVDLFVDPDERGRFGGDADKQALASAFSNLSGPYGPTIRRMSCCLDDWYNPGVGSVCASGFSCPADLTCNQ